MSSQKQKRMLSNKLIILLYAVFVSIVLHGCADRHFLQLERKITNDLKFNKAKTVVVDLELDKIDFSGLKIGFWIGFLGRKSICGPKLIFVPESKLSIPSDFEQTLFRAIKLWVRFDLETY